MFSIERFIEACRGAEERAVRELMEEAVREPDAVARACGEPTVGLKVLHQSPDLTIMDFAWAPWMCFKPHNHCMWSVVGIYSGREDNVFWRRTDGALEAAGARSVGVGEVAVLGKDVIHSVVNPIGKLTRALHVYGGDFFAPPHPRSEWDPETLLERPWDMDDTRRRFAEADARSRPR